MKLISVIVPVYNVEKYLDRCVESILRQSYSNLEVILIDDGSPDSCPLKCEEWALKDSRIRVYHKKNGGLSDARNAGMSVANGDYIAFVDSDDWIERDMYQHMLTRMIETGSDIVSCGAVRVWEDNREDQPMLRPLGSHVLETEDAMRALIQSTYLIQTVWNKLYRAELVRDILFEVGKIHEDEYWSWQVIAKAKKIATIDNNYYNYLQRSDSIMGDGYTSRPMLIIEAKKRRHEYILNHLPQLSDIDTLDLLYTCYYHACQVLKYEHGEQKKRYLREINSVACQCKITKEYLSRVSLLRKIRILSLNHCFSLVCRLDAALKNN